MRPRRPFIVACLGFAMTSAAAQDTAHYGVWSDLVVLHATVMNGDGASSEGGAP